MNKVYDDKCFTVKSNRRCQLVYRYRNYRYTAHLLRLLKSVLKRHNQHTLNTPLLCRVIYWLRLCQHGWHFTPNAEYFIWSGFLSIIKSDHESHHSLSVFSVQMIWSCRYFFWIWLGSLILNCFGFCGNHFHEFLRFWLWFVASHCICSGVGIFSKEVDRT